MTSKSATNRLAHVILRAPLLAALVSALFVLPQRNSLEAAEPGPPPVHAKTLAAAADGGVRTLRVKQPEDPFPGRVRLPESMLEGGKGWLNSAGEISVKDLRGKIVLIDFWTYCCINCMHILPDLKRLEEKYPNELVVIGVHSAKFDNEKDSEHIRDAIMRYDIQHPVVNDAEMTIWRNFRVQSWPTLVVVDPEGFYIGSQSGEGNGKLFEGVVEKLIAYHKAKGTLDTTPVKFALEREKLAPKPLKFPGKILADSERARLFITDTSHNRIVIAGIDGKLLDVIGSSAKGAADGAYEAASFNHPNGMALVGNTLYVADTENHLIRSVDLEARKVSTLAGTGAQADRIFSPLGNSKRLGGKLLDTPLNSPWDITHVKDTLYIAMAGPHQLWRHKIGGKTIEVFAGTGQEDLVDGPLLEASLAQPSSIDTDGKFLYFVDSESSSVRKVSLTGEEQVSTIAGPVDLPSGRLFQFGDVDGVGAQARLQHPIGLVQHDGMLFVADSYNHKIKQVVPLTGRVTTFLGDGKSGDSLSPPRFAEPHGLAVADGKLFIADTNNHRICAADLKTKAVSVLDIAGLEPPKPDAGSRGGSASDDGTPPETVEPQTIAAGNELVFEVAFQLPEGYKLNALMPTMFRLKSPEPQKLVAADHLDSRYKADTENGTARIRVPLAQQSGTAKFELSLDYGYCRDGVGGLCKIDTARWLVPVTVAADAPNKSVGLTAHGK